MITFNRENGIFRLDTKNTTYAMQVVRERHVAHIFYGRKTSELNNLYKERIVSFAPYPEQTGVEFSLDTIPTELSFFDSGDLKDTAIKIFNADGNAVTSFLYKEYHIFKGRINFENMPYSRNADETLELVYEDETTGCLLYSYYSVFYESDTISRYIRFENRGEKNLKIARAIACQLDNVKGDLNILTLSGEYFNERNYTSFPLHIGIQSVYSKRGHSSHQANPFIALTDKTATEYSGNAYGAEFIYSGDFIAQVEQTFDKRNRLLLGLHPDTFGWNLAVGESFTTPETIISFSASGTNQLSQNFHRHVREHVMPQKFALSPRPIVINTWEAMYFDINEELILKYADCAKELGIDTIVIDDGWFGERDDDKRGLGDWYVNRKKFKDGLPQLAEKIHKKGLKLGIWIEPEMISPDSNLYRRHPEWVLRCKNRVPSLGRNQLVLDITNDEAVRYVVDSLTETLKPIRPDYIKWDFNRSLSEVGSLTLSAEKQCEVKHRFVLGCYKMHDLLTKAFPDTLFEGCSGGGGRFDAGILFYCPQIWTSDNTDPVDRMVIQKGTAFAYPLSAISSHVSRSKFNRVEKGIDYDFRFNVSAGGILGYEMNITDFTEEEKELIKGQIKIYKELQPIVLGGDMYSIENSSATDYGFTMVSKDKTKFFAVYQNIGKANRDKFTINGLDNNFTYKDNLGQTYSGKDAEIDLKPVNQNENLQYLLVYGEAII